MASASSSSHLAARIEQLSAEDGEFRSPLAGLFRSDLPVVAIEDALLQVTSDCPNSHPKTGSCLKIAVRKAKKVHKKYPQLSLDECTSIVMYTMEEVPREASIYMKMNEALRAKDRSRVRPWRDFIWLLLHGLQKLPVMQISSVVRGCKKRPEDMSLNLETGDEITWSAFTSTATSVDVMNAFLGDDGPRTLLQIELTEPVARSIQDFSLFPSENEVLLPPNVCLKFVSKFNAGHGLVMMQFKQTETLDRLTPAAVGPQTTSADILAASAPTETMPEKASALVNSKSEQDGSGAETASLARPPLAVISLKKEERSLTTSNSTSTGEKDPEGKPAKKRARVGCQIPVPADMDAMRQLVSSGEIEKLPVPIVKDWLKSQKLAATGRREDLVARVRAVVAAK